MDLSLAEKSQRQADSGILPKILPVIMAKPSLMPKPILHDRTTMKLRVNFPSADGSRMEITEKDLIDSRQEIYAAVPGRRNSKLLSEGVARAMAKSAGLQATYDATEEIEDTFLDASNPWITETARRDSIEQTRKKMGSKGIGTAVTKGRNQRLRRGLREARRSTGVAMFDEMSSPVYQLDDEDKAQETRNNTARNEISHQLQHQTKGPCSGSMSHQRPLYRIESQPDPSQYPGHYDDQITGLNIEVNGSLPIFDAGRPQPIELEDQLTALVKNLHVTSHRF